MEYIWNEGIPLLYFAANSQNCFFGFLSSVTLRRQTADHNRFSRIGNYFSYCILSLYIKDIYRFSLILILFNRRETQRKSLRTAEKRSE